MNVTNVRNTSHASPMDSNTSSSPDAYVPTSPPEPGDPEAYLYDVGTRLFIVVEVLLVGFGCLGNLLTLLVVLRKNLRQSPVSVFIAALAVSDILVLLLDFLNNWLALQLDVYLMGNFPFCLFHRWFFNVVYTSSAWLVAGVAVERFLAVCFSLRAKSWCTMQRTVITVITIPIILSVLYAYNFWTWHVSGGKCAVRPYHAAFMNDVSSWLTGILYSYIPLMVIIFCSVSIIVRLCRAHATRAAMTGGSGTDSNTRKATITVLTICAAFCCLTMPLTIWYIWVFTTQQFIEQTARIVFIEICILIFGLSNHTINFFLYILSSERFRSELVAMFLCTSKSKYKSENVTGPSTDGSEDNRSASTKKTSSASSEQSINTVCGSP